MTRKHSTEEFIKIAQEKHNNFYLYPKTNYDGAFNKIIITCPIHGDFEQKANSHLNGHGCNKCAKIKNHALSRKKLEKFLEEAYKIHGTKYNYDLSEYLNTNTKIRIICYDHGEFWQTPKCHLKGQGCIKCGGRAQYSTAEWIKKAIEIHGYKYGYELVFYKDAFTKIVIICHEHGKFEQAPYSHLNGRGCPKCAHTKTGNRCRSSLEEFIEKSIKIHNNFYDYSLAEYIDSFIDIKIICPEHGIFKQKPYKHLAGVGCKRCRYKNNYLDFINKANIIHKNKYLYPEKEIKRLDNNIKIICPNHGEFSQKPYIHLGGSGCQKCCVSISKVEQEWLKSLNISENFWQAKLKINNKIIKPDAFDPNTNTIYEFYGDFWHGNPEIYDQNNMNKAVKKTFGELYQKTMEKEGLIKSAGYNLITIWENAWNKKLKA